MVYLLHFETRYQHAGHYTGTCEDHRLEERLEEHRTGRGARLMEVVAGAGIGFTLARTWDGDRRRETAQTPGRRLPPLPALPRRSVDEVNQPARGPVPLVGA